MPAGGGFRRPQDLQRLASASEVEVGEKFELPGAVQIITHAARALIPMDELIDREKELARLEKEREKCQSDIDFIGRKLDNPGFVAVLIRYGSDDRLWHSLIPSLRLQPRHSSG